MAMLKKIPGLKMIYNHNSENTLLKLQFGGDNFKIDLQPSKTTMC